MPALKAKTAEEKEWLKSRNKHVTGFCNDINKKPWCEGTKSRTHAGDPVPVCSAWKTCPCECHYRLDQMFSMTGIERIFVPNPEYVPPASEFVYPSSLDSPLVDDAVAPGHVIPPPIPQRNDADPAAPRVAPRPTTSPDAPLAIRRTETGRSARGGLEAQVWDACRSLSTEGVGEHLTPAVIGGWIAQRYKIPTPSSGAINAVWGRWSKLEFSTQAKKPNRFVAFTGDSSWEALQRLKGAAKRRSKFATSGTYGMVEARNGK